ncbi:MAG: type I 3-dehydroquinate dehydratase [Myxococcota bacterium]
MLCTTGAETTVEALAARLESVDGVHEVRLDHLDANGFDAVWALLARHAPRVLLCCRPVREGGRYAGDEATRLALLLRGAAAGVRYVDVEGDVPDDAVGTLDPARLVRSHHRFTPTDDPASLVAVARALAARRGAVTKLAVAVSDAAHLDALRGVREAIGGDAVLIGMGPAGLLSRARYRSFGSVWTYVAADAGRATAPGQYDVAAAHHQGLPHAADAPFAALVGGPQVLASPGPRVYPPLFARLGLSARSYLPVITTDLDRALPLLREVGAVGLSVTMPLKAEAAARAARQDPAVVALGVANSLRWRDSTGWEATNTDVVGVTAPLTDRVAPGARALVMGAGGAAAAAVEAARQLGLTVAVSARRFDAAARLAARWAPAGAVTAVPWAERTATELALLINATPLRGAATSPWPDDGTRLPARLVFDLALGGDAATSADTLLYRQAKAAGASYLEPEAMWRAQGAAQIGWFFDCDVPASALALASETGRGS